MALEALGIGGVVGGSIYEAMGAKGRAESEAAIHEYNAAVARQGAEAVTRSAGYEQGMMRERMRERLARQSTISAASGFMMDASPQQAELGIIGDYAHDIAMTGYNAETESAQLRNQAKLFEYQAAAAKEAGKLGVGQAVVGGISGLGQIALMKKIYTPQQQTKAKDATSTKTKRKNES